MFQLDVAPGITFVEGERRGRFPFGNVLALGAGGGQAPYGPPPYALVDTGCGDAALEALVAAGRPQVVINTHYHYDHVRGNRRLTGGEFQAPAFWCPAGESEAFTSWDGFRRFTGFGQVPAAPAYAGAAATLRPGLDWQPTPAIRELTDGEELDLGMLAGIRTSRSGSGVARLRAIVLRLPGHTPGHTGLCFPAERVVFAADIDLSTFGPWYGDAYADIDAYLASVRRLEAVVDEAAGGGRHQVTILTSHRRPLSYESFKACVPAFVARVGERDERILAQLGSRGPSTTAEVATGWPIYGAASGTAAHRLPGVWKSEYFMVRHHLDRLARAGRIERLPAEGAGSVPSGGNDLWRVR